MKTKLLLLMICAFLLPSLSYGQCSLYSGFNIGNYLTGCSNVGFGINTLNGTSITSFTGNDNILFGYGSMGEGTTGSNNTAIGFSALSATVSGDSNVAVGSYALLANQTNNNNTAIGYNALNNITNSSYNNIYDFGNYNTAIGSDALGESTGSNNVGVGYNALYSNTGDQNIGIGYAALYNNTGNDNVGIGYEALQKNTSGVYNQGMGYEALQDNTSGADNCGFGTYAGSDNQTGSYNTEIGYDAGNQTIADGNTFIGYVAGYDNQGAGGTYNTALGYKSDIITSGISNATAIGDYAVVGNSNTIVLGSNGFVAGSTAVTQLDFNGALAPASGSYGYDPGSTGYVLESQGAGYAPQWTNQSALTAGLTATYVGYGSGSNTLTGSSNLTFNYGTSTLSVGVANVDINSVPYQWTNTQGAANTVLDNDGSGDLTWQYGLYLQQYGNSQTILSGDNLTEASFGLDYGSGIAYFDNISDLYLGSGANVWVQSNETNINGVQYYWPGGGVFVDNQILTSDASGNLSWSGEISSSLYAANVFLGENAGNVGNAGSLFSVAVGWDALENNAEQSNVAVGYSSLQDNVTGSENTGIGTYALGRNGGGNSNTAIGSGALGNNDVSNNDAVGAGALGSNYSGTPNDAFGFEALNYNTYASKNTAMGYKALFYQDFYTSISSAYTTDNVAIGYYALYNNNPTSETSGLANNGNQNISIGDYSLYSNTTGAQNTALGFNAGYKTTFGDTNTFIGNEAGYSSTTDTGSTFIGGLAGGSITTGSYNTAIGYQTDFSSPTDTGATAIGYDALNNQGSNTVMIGSPGILTIGGLKGWTTYPSDKRVKTNIQHNVPGLVFIKKLQPITYKIDMAALNKFQVMPNGKQKILSKEEIAAEERKGKIINTGFIAQDVEAAAKSVGYDFDGVDAPKTANGLYGLRYDEFVVPLVKAVQELSAKTDSINSLVKQNTNEQQQIDSLTRQGAKQQSEIDQLNNMVSKLDQALSECCTNYQSTTTGPSQTGNTNTNEAPYLNQNYPNPFSQNTTISCYVPTTGQNASIVIYDLNGKALLSLTVPTTGYNQVVVAGGTLAAGEYLYTLYVNGQKIDTKKMTLTH